MRIARRSLHLSFAFGAWLLLTAARQAATPLPDMLLPLEPAHRVGEAFAAKPGDEVLRGRIVRSMVVKLKEPVTATLDRFTHDFQPGDELTPVLLRPEKNSRAKMIFCGPDQRAISKFTAAMIGEWGSKFEAIVRFCFEDEDNDGKFEGYILAGAKDPAQQTVTTITPVAYGKDDLVPYEKDSTLSIVYRKFSPDSQKITFDLKMQTNGEPIRFDYLRTMLDGAMKQNYAIFQTNPRKVPYPSHFDYIVGADIGVRSLDAATGEAQLIINRNFMPTLIKPVSIQTQYIYIYVYR